MKFNINDRFIKFLVIWHFKWKRVNIYDVKPLRNVIFERPLAQLCKKNLFFHKKKIWITILQDNFQIIILAQFSFIFVFSFVKKKNIFLLQDYPLVWLDGGNLRLIASYVCQQSCGWWDEVERGEVLTFCSPPAVFPVFEFVEFV